MVATEKIRIRTTRKTTAEIAAAAKRAEELNARMTDPQNEALRTASLLYQTHSVTNSNGDASLTGDHEAELRKVAGALIRVANGSNPKDVNMQTPLFQERAVVLLNQKGK